MPIAPEERAAIAAPARAHILEKGLVPGGST